LAEFDRRIAERGTRRQEVEASAAELRESLLATAEADRARLADWLVAGKGERPEGTVSALEERLQDAEQERAALLLAEERVLAEKADFVERHRGRLVKDAERATSEAREHYERAATELAAWRDELIAAREAALYAATYGTPASAESVPFVNVCAGIARPVKETLGVSAQISFPTLLSLLERDAAVISQVATPRQQEALGVDVTSGREAIGKEPRDTSSTNAPRKAKARRRYNEQWGVDPPPSV